MTRGEALPLTLLLQAATRTAEVAVAAIAPRPPHTSTMMDTILLPHPTAATAARLLEEAVLPRHPQIEAMDIPLPLANITRIKRSSTRSICKSRLGLTSNQVYPFDTNDPSKSRCRALLSSFGRRVLPRLAEGDAFERTIFRPPHTAKAVMQL